MGQIYIKIKKVSPTKKSARKGNLYRSKKGQRNLKLV